ncbi:hypothetical protein AC1031_007323 [Aphanomyces cochlioides]|nr:hypothetical protein AC1031_007323 [Aphanomyces cochlioides]
MRRRPDSPASESAQAALDAVKQMVPDPRLAEKMLKRRLYNREQQRLHRLHKSEEITRLREEAMALEAHVSQLAASSEVNDTGLPWKEVSCGLLEAIEDITRSNRTLKQNINDYHELIRHISAWVSSSCHVPRDPPEHRRPWRNVSLPSHPPSRKLGFDWITQQLYHNADLMFQQFKFPALSSHEYLGDFTCDSVDDEGFQYTWRVQREMRIPFDQVARTIQENVVHYLLGASWSKEWSAVNVLSSEPIDTPLLQEIGGKIAYARSQRSPDETVNFLCREFNEDGKLTIVAQHILDDENQQTSRVQCNRMFWVTVDWTSEETTTMRVLFLSSNYFNKDGFVSFDDECLYHWGLDLTNMDSEELKVAHFQRHIARAGNEFVGALSPFLKFL